MGATSICKSGQPPIGCSDQTQEDALGQQDQRASTSYDPIKDPQKGGVKQILSLEMVATWRRGVPDFNKRGNQFVLW